MSGGGDHPDVSQSGVASRLRGHVVALRARLRTPSAAWSRASDKLALAYAEDALAQQAEAEIAQAELELRTLGGRVQ